jgi:hypothetical protein
MITRTSVQFSLDALRLALDNLLTKTCWHERNNQIALTRATEVPSGVEPFHHGTGDWLDPKTGAMIFPESHFNLFDERLRGTYFEEVYDAITGAIPEKVARVRLMRLLPCLIR